MSEVYSLPTVSIFSPFLFTKLVVVGAKGGVKSTVAICILHGYNVVKEVAWHCGYPVYLWSRGYRLKPPSC